MIIDFCHLPFCRFFFEIIIWLFSFDLVSEGALLRIDFLKLRRVLFSEYVRFGKIALRGGGVEGGTDGTRPE